MTEYDEVTELVEDGLAALRGGDLVQARSLFGQAVLKDRENERAWLGLAMAFEERERKISALEKVLQINPENPEAKEMLDELLYRSASGGRGESEARQRVGSIADRVFSRLSSTSIPQSEMSFLDKVYAVLGIEEESDEGFDGQPSESKPDRGSVIRPLKPDPADN